MANTVYHMIDLLASVSNRPLYAAKFMSVTIRLNEVVVRIPALTLRILDSYSTLEGVTTISFVGLINLIYYYYY